MNPKNSKSDEIRQHIESKHKLDKKFYTEKINRHNDRTAILESLEINNKKGKNLYSQIYKKVLKRKKIYNTNYTETRFRISASSDIKNNSFDVKTSNESDNFSEVALQGPKAEYLLQQLTDFDLNELKFFTHQNITVNGNMYLVSRTGYTGEDGFEIYGTHDDVVEIWDKLLSFGKDIILPIGLGARDTLRFEVNLPLYGHELTKDITPLEAGYSFAVRLGTGDFIGKDVLVKQKIEGTTRRICGLEMVDKGIMREGYKVYHQEQLVGYITTGYKSPSTGKTVALAMIDRPYDKLGTELTVEIRNKFKKVKVIKKKFYSKNYKK